MTRIVGLPGNGFGEVLTTLRAHVEVAHDPISTVLRRRQQHSQIHDIDAESDSLDDATVPFSSLFSSLWKRQSVPSASVREVKIEPESKCVVDELKCVVVLMAALVLEEIG